MESLISFSFQTHSWADHSSCVIALGAGFARWHKESFLLLERSKSMSCSSVWGCLTSEGIWCYGAQKSLTFKQGNLCRHLAESYSRGVTDPPLNTSIPAYLSGHRWLLLLLEYDLRLQQEFPQRTAWQCWQQCRDAASQTRGKWQRLHRCFRSGCSTYWCILCVQVQTGTRIHHSEFLALTRSGCCSKYILP